MSKIQELKEILKEVKLEDIGYSLPSDFYKEKGADRAIKEINRRRKQLAEASEMQKEELALKWFQKWDNGNQFCACMNAELSEADMSDWCDIIGSNTEAEPFRLKGVKDCPLSLDLLYRAKSLAKFRGLDNDVRSIDFEIDRKEENN